MAMARRKTMRPMPWLRQRLRAVDATASDLARHLEVPPARVYEMIKGQRQFQPHEIAKAASFLKIGEGQFLKLIEGKLEAKDVTIDDVTALPWANTDVTSVPLLRSEARRVGEAGVRTCGYRGTAYRYKTKNNKNVQI